jgi:hypothetical protein
LIQTLNEHREAALNHLLGISVVDQTTTGVIAQLKGQINTIDTVLDFYTFLEGKEFGESL